MTTKTLPEMVDMVSSILTNYPVQPKQFHGLGIIVISTPIWDFYFNKFKDSGYYVFDDAIANSYRLAEEMSDIKKILMREVICKYGITNCL